MQINPKQELDEKKLSISFMYEFNSFFSFIKAYSEIVEDVHSANDMKSNAKAAGETYLGFKFMSSDRNRKLKCKNFNERAIANFDKFFFSAFNFQTKNLCGTSLEDGITGTAVHKSQKFNPFLSLEPDRNYWQILAFEFKIGKSHSNVTSSSLRGIYDKEINLSGCFCFAILNASTSLSLTATSLFSTTATYFPVYFLENSCECSAKKDSDITITCIYNYSFVIFKTCEKISGNHGSVIKESSQQMEQSSPLKKDGNVGIGTTSPSEVLSVNGNVSIEGTNCRDSGGSATCNNFVDIAELFSASEAVDSGDVVVVDFVNKGKVQKSQKEYEKAIVGIKCKNCNSIEVIKKGIRKGKLQSRQIYQCKSCNSKFILAEIINKTYPISIILKSISNYNLGYNLQQTQEKIEKTENTKISISTISSWLKEYKNICTYAKLRSQAIKLCNPKGVIKKQTLSHIQPYTFKYHKAKLHLLFHNILYNNQFHNISHFYEPLKNYLEKIDSKEFPHYIFTYDKSVGRPDAEIAKNILSNDNSINNKGNVGEGHFPIACCLQAEKEHLILVMAK